MYNNFFGFKKKPFELSPDPEFLFLSKSHEKALAHLIFTVSHGEGFVGITGKEGTGKTTLCRAFLANLDESIKAAYIFNPELDALQLLKAINYEFGIDSKSDNTEDLISGLNGFLIKKKVAGQKVLLIIDEAQDLPLEVLEQNPLFSSPETTREKLLQIVLFGQPQLGDMLSSPELKELGQRITKKCHLNPLTFLETIDYIRHRISHASHKADPPFDKASCRVIYEYSKGIPQLINVGCDMALQTAFNRKSFKVTGAITREAIQELARQKTDKPFRKLKRAPVLAILAAIFIPLIVIFFYSTQGVPPENTAINETTNSTKLLASSEPIDSAVAKPAIPEKPLEINQSKSVENISLNMGAYSVHVGNFQSASQANWRLKNLKSLGFPSFILTGTSKEGNAVYAVIAGTYQTYDLAEEASQSLNKKGHSNSIAKTDDSLNEGPTGDQIR